MIEHHYVKDIFPFTLGWYLINNRTNVAHSQRAGGCKYVLESELLEQEGADLNSHFPAVVCSYPQALHPEWTVPWCSACPSPLPPLRHRCRHLPHHCGEGWSGGKLMGDGGTEVGLGVMEALCLWNQKIWLLTNSELMVIKSDWTWVIITLESCLFI